MAEVDDNAILVATMKNRTEGEIIKAYFSVLRHLKNAGIKPKHPILDKEASEEYEATIIDNGLR